MIPTTDP